MKKISLLALTICLIFTACNADETIIGKNNKVENDLVTKNEESKNLEKLYNEIVELSKSNTECTGDWGFVAVGSKPCGEPEKYIPYSLKINLTDFLAKVNTYNLQQEDFNEKWNIISTCVVTPKPISVDCVNGKPTLLYESDKFEEEQNLKKMYNEIIALSTNSDSCTGNWHFTAIGSTPCGGPENYIPYSLQINTTDFLAKVNIYNSTKMAFNNKWKITSICQIAPKPESAKCINGKATLLYESDRASEKQNLEKMYNEIIALSSSSTSCDGNWNFTAIGSKPCGGPEKYIPYSLQINTAEFLNKVNLYNIAEMEFNEKWDISSNCDLVTKPKSVVCINGKATLVYN
jgi:hypothetical protein